MFAGHGYLSLTKMRMQSTLIILCDSFNSGLGSQYLWVPSGGCTSPLLFNRNLFWKFSRLFGLCLIDYIFGCPQRIVLSPSLFNWRFYLKKRKSPEIGKHWFLNFFLHFSILRKTNFGSPPVGRYWEFSGGGKSWGCPWRCKRRCCLFSRCLCNAQCCELYIHTLLVLKKKKSKYAGVISKYFNRNTKQLFSFLFFFVHVTALQLPSSSKETESRNLSVHLTTCAILHVIVMLSHDQTKWKNMCC